jgi:penicillin-binding protein 1A
MGEETAFKMLNLLEGVINNGTGIRLRLKYDIHSQIGGKTGTTQNQSDGWFIGVSPKLVSGAWVGGEYRSIHFDNIAYGQGANTALPIWGLYMQSVYNDETIPVTPADSFDIPEDIYIPPDCDHVFRSSGKDSYQSIEENW